LTILRAIYFIYHIKIFLWFCLSISWPTNTKCKRTNWWYKITNYWFTDA